MLPNVISQTRKGIRFSEISFKLLEEHISPPPIKPLPVPLEKQCLSGWCWAALCVSIARFFDKESLWTQCSIANAELPDLDGLECCNLSCMDFDSRSLCNQGWCLQNALFRTGNLCKFAPAQTSFDEILNRISCGEPICCQVVSPVGAHYIIIVGAVQSVSAGNWLEVRDPWDLGQGYFKYENFCKNGGYNNKTWTDTIFTRKKRIHDLWL